MLRVCLYARFSTENQKESSVDDQFRICRLKIESNGWKEVAAYYDMAISGSTRVADRQGGSAMLTKAMTGQFDVLIMEGLDRLSRDQVEQEKIVRRLEHLGIRIMGVSDGYDSTHSARKVLRGVRGLINEIYLDDLRKKTHRGQTGQVERGYIAGGKSFGYDIVKVEGGSQYRINEDEAKWIRFIFEQYADGLSVQKIAHRLNELGVESPRKSLWGGSAIYGSPVKGSGILNNRLYIGELVWNRSKWVKNPDTGKRQRFERPKEEWKVIQRPELKIIDDTLWARVRKRIDTGRDEHGRKRYMRKGNSLFGGLMLCPYCGGKLVVVNGHSYGCIEAKEKGKTVCNGFSVNRDKLEKALLKMLKNDLLSVKAAQQFEQHFKKEVNKILNDSQVNTKALQEELAKIDDSIDKLITAIMEMDSSTALTDKLKELEVKKLGLTNQIKREPLKIIKLPNLKQLFSDVIERFDNVLKEQDPDKARQIVLDVFGLIEIEMRGKEVWAKINTAQSLDYAIEPMKIKVVAEAGFEPTTFGL